MVFRVSEPLALVLLILPLWAMWLWKTSPWGFSRTRRRVIGALRVVILTSLVLALAGAEMLVLVRAQSVAYVVDNSQSVRALSSEIEEWVRSSIKGKRADDEASVIVFGKNASVDVPSTTNPAWHNVQSIVDPDRTDIESALRLASAILPANKRRRVVLISDGNQNIGDVLSISRNLHAQGIRVDVVPVIPQKGKDVLVDRIDAPGQVNEGEEFTLGIRLRSNFEGKGRLRIFRGTSIIQDSPVQWQAGETGFLVRVKSGEPGLWAFKASLEADEDTVVSNNEASAVVNILGRARALVIAGSLSAPVNISAALKAAGVDVRVVRPADMPRSVEGWSQYSMIVIAEVPAQEFPEKAMETLEIAVRDMGCGLVMVGGDESFGPGGYFRTPVERALPVYMDIRGKGEIPTLGLLLVIDKSGSMSETSAGISKMDLAKEAAIRSTEVLGPQDLVGVIAFDGESKWVLEPQNPVDLARIQDQIATIRAGGGTNIYPGLEMAYEALKGRQTKYKHVILLTDGMSAAGGDYEALLKEMRDAGITLSTVAVGNDADTALLERLAKLGEGRYYFTNDTTSIPRIFTKETILASRNYFVEAAFVPTLVWPSLLAKDLQTVPPLNGYVATTAKEMAQVVLSSHKDEPLLAKWQYGLGRSVAWTSDTRGRWARTWIESGHFAKLWRNIAGWVIQPSGILGFDVETTVRGETGVIELDTPPGSGVTRASARVVCPDQSALEVQLEQVIPGKYRGTFEASRPGAYLIHVTPQAGTSRVGSISTGLTVPYSPEYKVSTCNLDLLKEVARLGGGSVLDSPAQAWEPNLKPTFATVPLWPFLLMLACLSLPIEVALRKLYIGKDELQKAVGVFLEWKKRSNQVAPRDVAMSRLLARKSAQQRGLLGRSGPIPLIQREEQKPGTSAERSLTPGAEPGPPADRKIAEDSGSSPGKSVPGETAQAAPRTIDTSRLLQRRRRGEETEKLNN